MILRHHDLVVILGADEGIRHDLVETERDQRIRYIHVKFLADGELALRAAGERS